MLKCQDEVSQRFERIQSNLTITSLGGGKNGRQAFISFAKKNMYHRILKGRLKVYIGKSLEGGSNPMGEKKSLPV